MRWDSGRDAIARVTAAQLENLEPDERQTFLALVSKAAGLTNSYYRPEN